MTKFRPFKQVLLWLVAGSRGGVNRGRIIVSIRKRPMNANQLVSELGIDYKTIRHHLEVLEENSVVASMGEHYGKVYFPSMELEQSWGDFEEIWGEIVKTLKNGERGGQADE